MEYHASGTFDVKLSPQPATGDWGLGRLSIDKQFHGDLTATSAGEMLSTMTGVAGSAAYVALERVSGTLHGRHGAFTLQHTGVMTRGDGQLTISVVPDSGEGELVGLAGQMTIRIDGDAHHYAFGYRLGEAASRPAATPAAAEGGRRAATGCASRVYRAAAPGGAYPAPARRRWPRRLSARRGAGTGPADRPTDGPRPRSCPPGGGRRVGIRALARSARCR